MDQHHDGAIFYVNYQQSDRAELLPFAKVAYNKAVHRSTGLTPFQMTSGVEFVPVTKLPREPSSSKISNKFK